MAFTRMATVASVVAGVSMLLASPAFACNNSDAGLNLAGNCGSSGPDWVVKNSNNYQIPFDWKDNQGQQGSSVAPPEGSIALTTHASQVTVDAHKPNGDLHRAWRDHGATKTLKCATLPSTPPTRPTRTPPPPKSPSPVPTVTVTPSAGPSTPPPGAPTPSQSSVQPPASPAPSPTRSTPPSAPAAPPVTKTPTFTG